MTATTISIVLGALIFLVAGISFLINILVLIIIWKGGFLKNVQSHIFIFVFATLAGNALQMAIAVFYLGPSAIAQDFLFPGEHGGTGLAIISYLSVGQYYQEMFLQAIIAIDRTYIYYKTYSFAYFGTLGFNYVDKYVDLPVNITSSLIAIVSYTIAGKFFDDFYDLVVDTKEWIVSKNRNFFARGIDFLSSKWEAVLKVDGEYAPE
uniref:Uncharacterized protein n=1 Tax=Acrobeloides nanus TaxID=290746 RepID=A0A914EHX0_9BILA